MDYNKALHFSAVITDLASKSQQYFGQLLDDGEASPSGCLPFSLSVCVPYIPRMKQPSHQRCINDQTDYTRPSFVAAFFPWHILPHLLSSSAN